MDALLGELGMHEFAQLHGQFVFHGIVHALPVFAAGQNAAGGQQRQMLRNIGLGGPDGRHNLVYATGFLTYGLQNPQSHRLPQYSEPAGNLIQFLRGEKTCVFSL